MACVYRINARNRCYIGLSTNFTRRLDEHERGLKDANDSKLLYRWARSVNLSEIAKHCTVLHDGLSEVDAALTEIVCISEVDKKLRLNATGGGETREPMPADDQDIVDEALLDFYAARSDGAYARLWLKRHRKSVCTALKAPTMFEVSHKNKQQVPRSSTPHSGPSSRPKVPKHRKKAKDQ